MKTPEPLRGIILRDEDGTVLNRLPRTLPDREPERDKRIYDAFVKAIEDMMDNPAMTEADVVAVLKKAVLDPL